MIDLLIPAGILAGMSAIFGAGLAIASKYLAVEKDERIPLVRECLPGANCGACGYPGCDGYAAAIVNDGAPVNVCPSTGKEGAAKIAEIMGLDAPDSSAEKKYANIICRGDCDNCKIRFDYDGPKTCRAVAMTQEGDKACRYACVGYGDCAAVCPFGAITVKEGRIATVDEDKCIGCGLCAQACPKNVIRIEPHYKVRVKCRALEKGKTVRDNCTAGCIACGKCEKSCKFDAIEMVGNLPQINRDKCVGCLECARNCPTGAMWAELSKQKAAKIDEEKCIGCTLCARACKFDAIEGVVKGTHKVDESKCTGCGQCMEKCRKEAISLVERTVAFTGSKKPQAPKQAEPAKNAEPEQKAKAE